MFAFIKKISLSILLLFMATIMSYGQAITSSYTKINLDECTLLDTSDMGASWACPGYKGYPLYVAEGDLRFFVSYGFGALDEMAASQTLPAFNNINDTLEWRLTQINGNFTPFATILRFITEYGEMSELRGNILVVTKLEQGNTCHIAYIDAQIVPNANELAREIADNYAQNFDCQNDEIYRIPT